MPIEADLLLVGVVDNLKTSNLKPILYMNPLIFRSLGGNLPVVTYTRN